MRARKTGETGDPLDRHLLRSVTPRRRRHGADRCQPALAYRDYIVSRAHSGPKLIVLNSGDRLGAQASGKLVIAGAKREKQVYEAAEKLNATLLDFDLLFKNEDS